jgi:murein DD-endopeptidase MepM/ murein hydrolase activator NlpD
LVFVLSLTVLVALPAAAAGQTPVSDPATPDSSSPEVTSDPEVGPAPTETPEPAPQALPAPGAAATPTPSVSPVPVPAPVVPVLPRTRPRNTAGLVEILDNLTEWGFPLEQVLVEGMGRFPVAGSAHYTDDWLAARHEPTFHLHEGLDIFADFGTPIRAPDAGVVTRSSDSYPGGVSVTMRVHDGTVYYFAHLLRRAEELQVGQSVEMGTVLGYVGNSGNADGGAPHLHFEVNRGGEAQPPKPIVDGWLDEAEAAAGDWMEVRRLELDVARRLPDCAAEAGPDPATSLLRMLLDPVGLELGDPGCSEPMPGVDDTSALPMLDEVLRGTA